MSDLYLPQGTVLSKAYPPKKDGGDQKKVSPVKDAKSGKPKKKAKPGDPETVGGHHLGAKPRRGGGHTLDFGHGVESDHHDGLAQIDHEAEMHKHSRRSRAFKESAEQLEAAGHDGKIVSSLKSKAEAHKRAALHHKGEWEKRGGGVEEDPQYQGDEPLGMGVQPNQNGRGGPKRAPGGGMGAAIASRAQQANVGRTMGGPKLPGGRGRPPMQKSDLLFPTLEREGGADVCVPLDVQMRKAAGPQLAARPGHWIGAAPLTEGGGSVVIASATVVQPNAKCYACTRYDGNRTLCTVGSYPDICGPLFQAVAGIDLPAEALAGGLGADPADAGAVASAVLIEDGAKSVDAAVPRNLQAQRARSDLRKAFRTYGEKMETLKGDDLRMYIEHSVREEVRSAASSIESERRWKCPVHEKVIGASNPIVNVPAQVVGASTCTCAPATVDEVVERVWDRAIGSLPTDANARAAYRDKLLTEQSVRAAAAAVLAKAPPRLAFAVG